MRRSSKTFTIICALVTATAFTAPPADASTAGTNSVSAAGCTASASEPTYNLGTIYSYGWVSCSSTVTSITVRVDVVDGGQTGVSRGRATNTCRNASYCGVTATAVNRSGNQTWCTATEGTMEPFDVQFDFVCENNNWSPAK